MEYGVGVQFAVYVLLPVEPAGMVTVVCAEDSPVPVQPVKV